MHVRSLFTGKSTASRRAQQLPPHTDPCPDPTRYLGQRDSPAVVLVVRIGVWSHQLDGNLLIRRDVDTYIGTMHK